MPHFNITKSNRLDLVLRGLNFFFLIVVLGLTGSLISGQDDSNSRVNFALFASVFGLITSTIYGALAQVFQPLAWPVLSITLEFLNVVFTFAAATALAVGIRVHSCSNDHYLDTNAITEGSSDRCRKAQCATAFLFFSFFTFLVSFIAQVASSNTIPGKSSKARPAIPTLANPA